MAEWHDRSVISPEMGESYEIADKYTPALIRLIRRGLVGLGPVIEHTIRDALREYYNAATVMTAIEVSAEVRATYERFGAEFERKIESLWLDASAVTHDNALYMYEQRFAAKRQELTQAAIDYAQKSSGALIEGVSASQLEGIRTVLADGIENGLHPDVIARNTKIRAVGLSERGPHSYARLDRYWESVAEEGYSDKEIARRVSAFKAKLIRDRAEAIARTEAAMAQAHARRKTWANDVASGLIDNRAERVWIAGIARTCPDCTDMDGATAPIDKPYEGGYDGPPLHPKCRCTEGLRIP